jgi:hypothetical protein
MLIVLTSGILTWAKGWDYTSSQFLLNRWYVVPIWAAFRIQAALYSVRRFRLFVLTATTDPNLILCIRIIGTSL